MSRDHLLSVLFVLLPRLSFRLQLNPAVFIGFCAEKERAYLWVECSQALKKGENNAALFSYSKRAQPENLSKLTFLPCKIYLQKHTRAQKLAV